MPGPYYSRSAGLAASQGIQAELARREERRRYEAEAQLAREREQRLEEATRLQREDLKRQRDVENVRWEYQNAPRGGAGIDPQREQQIRDLGLGTLITKTQPTQGADLGVDENGVNQYDVTPGVTDFGETPSMAQARQTRADTERERLAEQQRIQQAMLNPGTPGDARAYMGATGQMAPASMYNQPVTPTTPDVKFGDYLRATYGPNPSPTQMIEARTAWERAGQRPVGGTQGGRQQPYQWVLRGSEPTYTDQTLPGDVPVSRAGGIRNPISGDANRIADYDTSLDEVAELRQFVQGGTGTASAIGQALPSFVTDLTGIGAAPKARQAVIARAKQVIGKAFEGGVLRKEDEIKYADILPTIADPDSIVASKIAGLERTVEARRQRLLESLEDAGYDVSGYPARSRRRNDGGGGGGAGGAFSVTAPNGKTYDFKSQAELDAFKQRAGIR